MNNESINQDGNKRPGLFGIPAPETSPRIVSPQAAEDRTDQAEDQPVADNTVRHARQQFGDVRRQEDREPSVVAGPLS